jgi:hypothetical protein
MYRLKNILASNNSENREALGFAFSMVAQLRDAMADLGTGLSK